MQSASEGLQGPLRGRGRLAARVHFTYTLDAVTGIEARDTFSSNNLFRQASFRPKKGIEFEELVKASEAFRDTFGGEIRRVQEIIEGERLASVQVQPYFGAGIEMEEQLDTALAGLRDECSRLIRAGKKVVLQ